MSQHYKSNFPNQVHQLLVSVSKHYIVGAKNRIRYQKKEMDVSLGNFEKSEREHLVYYILRDHFSNFYYVEITSTKKIIPLQDFLLRGFLPKPDLSFCGLPKTLTVPKQVEEYFPSVDKMLEDLNIQKVYPPSGFASGITAFTDWEKLMKIPLLPDEGFDNFTLWNPRTSARYCGTYRAEKLKSWTKQTSEISLPSEEYARQTSSSEFKFAHEYPLSEPLWKLARRNTE